MTTRRTVITGAAALVLAGLGYRAWDRGVFAGSGGPAYAPWGEWRGSPADGKRRPLRAAILAANPHDTQPWMFAPKAESITVFADRSRNLGSFDPFRREMHLGLGAAIENLVRAAGVFGYSANVVPVEGRLALSPGPDVVAVADIRLDAAPAAQDELFEQIPRRHTSRGPYRPDRPIQPEILARFVDLVSDESVRVNFVTDPGQRSALGALIVEATARIIADPQMSADSARWFRSGVGDILAHRDGVTVDTSGLSPLLVAAAKLMPDQDVATADRYWLEMTRDTQVPTAPVLGAILVRDRLDMRSALAAGRAWQRLHLLATAAGIAAQPLNQPIECVDRNAMLGRADNFAPALAKLAEAPGWAATFAFRMGYAERAVMPSPRRPLEEVLTGTG